NALMAVKSLALSLAALASPATEAVAWLTTLGNAAAPTLTVSVIVVESPMASAFGFVQVTLWPEAEKVQPAPAPDTKLSPAGKVSLTIMLPLVAALPTFVSLMV